MTDLQIQVSEDARQFQQPAEVVQTVGHVRVIGPQFLHPDRQSPLVKGSCRRVVATVSEQGRESEEGSSQVGVVWRQDLLADRKGALDAWRRVGARLMEMAGDGPTMKSNDVATLLDVEEVPE